LSSRVFDLLRTFPSFFYLSNFTDISINFLCRYFSVEPSNFSFPSSSS
jgi:hypothetical protein